MSKNVPALRFHGNKEAGVRHIKRGLYELFRAQELQKKMGVPVYKRSVEVSEYTSITVEIHKEQTFVHIYCNPPELPEVVPPPSEEEKEIIYKCPSAFLIRAPRDLPTPTSSGDYTLPEGYLYGYNHLTGVWQKVTYRDDSGSIVDVQAGNVGWYHLPRSDVGTFNECDVVTWVGPSTPGPLSPIHFKSIFEEYAYLVLRNRVFFQGRAYSVFSGRVVGACILKVPSETGGLAEYMYVHTFSDEAGYEGRRNLKNDIFQRIKLSKLLATPSEQTPQWESVGSITVDNAKENYPYFHPELDYLYYPTSTDYVDKDGFAYFIRIYASNPPGAPIDVYMQGCTVFIKANMRDGTYEILNSSYENQVASNFSIDYSPFARSTTLVPASEITWSEDAEFSVEGVRAVTAVSASAGSKTTNVGKPWIFYVYSGTQDLYTLAIEHYYNQSSTVDGYSDPDSSAGYVTHAGHTGGHTDLIVYKNNKEFKRIRLVTVIVNGSHTSETNSEGDVTREWGPCSSTYEWAAILEYHPEIEDCYTAVHFSTGSAGLESEINVLATYYDKNRVIATRSVRSYPSNIPYDGFSRWTHQNWLIPGFVLRTLEEDPPTHLFQLWDTIQATIYNRQKTVAGTNYAISDIQNNAVFLGAMGTGSMTYPGISIQPCIGSYQPLDLKYWVYGLPGWMGVKQIANTETEQASATYFPACYALHRPVKGTKKPYMQLRAKRYINSGFANVGGFTTTNLYTEFGVGMADTDPGPDPVSACDPYHNTSGLTWDLLFNYSTMWWSKPQGSLKDINDPDGSNEPHYNDEAWELLSNFTNAKTLNSVFRESDNIFFGIGII